MSKQTRSGKFLGGIPILLLHDVNGRVRSSSEVTLGMGLAVEEAYGIPAFSMPPSPTLTAGRRPWCFITRDTFYIR